MARSMEEIAELLKNTRFRRRLSGGVDEYDVWKKLERLQREYAELVEAERQQAQGAVNEWRKCAADLAAQLRKKDEQLKRLAMEHLRALRTAGTATPGNGHG